MYKVIWEKEAIKELKLLDKSIAKNIKDKIDKYLSKEPNLTGKPLKGNLSGLWSYRFGKYRVIYKIRKEIVTIYVTRIGHREYAYDEEL